MYRDVLLEKKKKMGWTTEELSARSGVPVGTINKILNGETTSPRYDTISALNQAFEAFDEIPGALNMLRETGYYGTARRDRLYTVDDYYSLPSDHRAELIDGFLFDMSSPSATHQSAVTELVVQFYNFIRSRKGNCRVFPAPLDVQLDCNEYTMVQPDFMVVCDEEKIQKDRIFGAPDFIAEVISTSSKKVDTNIKLLKYIHAGVKEYWIVDAEHERVLCYFFPEDGLMPTIYPYHDGIPVQLYSGELKIFF